MLPLVCGLGVLKPFVCVQGSFCFQSHPAAPGALRVENVAVDQWRVVTLPTVPGEKGLCTYKKFESRLPQNLAIFTDGHKTTDLAAPYLCEPLTVIAMLACVSQASAM